MGKCNDAKNKAPASMLFVTSPLGVGKTKACAMSTASSRG